MAQYQVYAVDRSGRFRSGIDAEYRDDTEALAGARAHLLQGTQAEVWRGPNCVGQVCAADAEPQAMAWAVAAGRWHAGGFGLSALR